MDLQEYFASYEQQKEKNERGNKKIEIFVIV